ncbi:TIGR02530 family flagellar biosynthesis protein [Miltoncostaea marina]|uniref:TIGR02530 family flagellar biosynthesis protein n=1 Tax=Miltoncostaea marina TaxID=2843215 RepID=UPI001C3E3519|nr:TIGR02530 family flagellar biosynthesis protein [Miltoncostaea marina]
MSIERPVAPAGAVAGTTSAAAAGRAREVAAPGFDGMLAERLRPAASPQPVRWSAHAVQRLSQREIAVTPDLQGRLEGAVDRLAAKGGRESVVLMDRMAFVVSVQNRTVITAVDQAGMRDQVFTNIDSAVLS